MVKMWEEIQEQPLVLEQCLKYNKKKIDELTDIILQRKINFCVIAARGTSDHAGIYGKYIIECEVGIPVALTAASVVTVYKKNISYKNCLVIGISQSGKAEDVRQILSGAHKNGALTVSITNDEKSALAVEADHHLFCNAGLEESVAATKTFTSQMYLLAQLVAQWSSNNGMKKELQEVPDNLRKMFVTEDQVKGKIERFRFMNECFVLARGINYPIAMEAALKIQETSYVRAKAFATSDFHHGPFAMIQRDMPVIIYAPNGPSLKDTLEMIDKLKQSEAELVVVSNNILARELGQCSFEIPETSNDIISPFYNIFIAQMFACQLSLLKGLNPDAPRGLKKITITR